MHKLFIELRQNWTIITSLFAISLGFVVWLLRQWHLRRARVHRWPFIKLSYMSTIDDEKKMGLVQNVKSKLRPECNIKYLFVLADYGCGKSYFLHYLHYWLLRRQWWLGLKPRLVKLATQDLETHLQNVPIQEQASTILLLDGLDEDKKAMLNVHERFNEIVTRTQNFAKIVITSRLNFWGDYHPEKAKVFVENFEQSKAFFHICPLSDKEIKSYLFRKFFYMPWVAERIWQQICANESFRDLASRPLLLSYMTPEILDKILPSNAESIVAEPLKNMKRKFFDVITERNYKRKDCYFFRDFDSFNRIMMVIAKDLTIESRIIPFAKFYEYYQEIRSKYDLKEDFNKDYIKALEQEEKAVKHRSLLAKDSSSISFSHRSISEYYTALYIEHYLLAKNRYYNFPEIPTKEVGDLICFERGGFRFIAGGMLVTGKSLTPSTKRVSPFFIKTRPVSYTEFEEYTNDKNLPRRMRPIDSHATPESTVNDTWKEAKAYFGAYLGDKKPPYLKDSAQNLQLAAPIINVTWHEAKAYCDWLALRLNKSFRLPTEDEWEITCRGGARDDFIRMIDGRSSDAYLDANTPNFLGVYGFDGNNWEWCEDFYDGTKLFRSGRGGGGLNDAYGYGGRRGIPADAGNDNIRFRIVYSITDNL
ncbi:MAG TPA: SUMF1/EgtB/PvdO family nonheme iron enzyme [Verrucomicrobiae bacterium]|jgi:hypothetical protein